MTMPVSPGGSYFGFFSELGDVYLGVEVSFASAVASAASDGARDVGELLIPGSIDSPPVASTHPKIISFTGGGFSMAVNMTYDNGYWDDPPSGGAPFLPSNFLVELQGPNAADFVLGDEFAYSIYHSVSSDGGQTLYLYSSVEGLLTGLTSIKIWRTAIFPGDEPSDFWTSFVGSREVM